MVSPALLPLLGGAAGAGIGGAVGGALGQLSDTLSYPRRFLWHDLLGLPERGSEVLSQYGGMDPNSLLTQLGGMGLEMAGDPVTWATMGLGGLAGGVEGGALAARAGLEGEIASQTALRDAAEAAMAQHADEIARIGAQQEGRFAQLGNVVDVPGLATGAERTFTANYDPIAAYQMQQAGLGRLEDVGKFGKFTMYGNELPSMYSIGGRGDPWMRTMIPEGMPTMSYEQARDLPVWDMGGGIERQMMRFPRPEPGTIASGIYPAQSVFPNQRELFHILQQIAARDAQAAAGSPLSVLSDAAKGMAGELSPAMPMMSGMPADLASRDAGLALTQALGDLSEFDRARALPPELRAAMIGSGLGAGAMLGVNAAQPAGKRFF